MCTNDDGGTDFFLYSSMSPRPLPWYPVSNRRLTWVERRCATTADTRNQTRTSALRNFGSQTFLFPSVSPVQSQNCSEVRKAFGSQNTFKEHSPVTTWMGRKDERSYTGCRPGVTILRDRLWCLCSIQAKGSKQSPQSLVLMWTLAPNLKTTLKGSTVFFGTGKQNLVLWKWGQLGMVTFLFILLSWHYLIVKN